jgi:hypothetical protein
VAEAFLLDAGVGVAGAENIKVASMAYPGKCNFGPAKEQVPGI